MMKAFCTVAAALFLLLTSTAAQAADVKPMEIGEKAIPFSLPGVDGKTYTLDSFSDAEILVFVFTANHCPTAQAYEGRIKQLHADYKDKGVAVVAISPNDDKAVRLDELGYTDVGDTFEDMKIRAEWAGFEFPYLYAGDKTELCKQYGPIATPHVFIFDSERALRYQGRIDDNEKPQNVEQHDARNAIDALLAGQEPPVETTKTFGCSIKWPDKRGSVDEALERWAKEPVELKSIDAAGIKELVKNNTDKLLLINVWATWCGPCVTEFPELVTMHRMYRNRDFQLITISADSPERQDKVLEFLRKNEASMSNYIFSGDNKYDLAEAVDPEWLGALPYTMLVKPGGEVAFRKMEALDPLELKQEIVSILGRVYP